MRNLKMFQENTSNDMCYPENNFYQNQLIILENRCTCCIIITGITFSLFLVFLVFFIFYFKKQQRYKKEQEYVFKDDNNVTFNVQV